MDSGKESNRKGLILKEESKKMEWSKLKEKVKQLKAYNKINLIGESL